MKKKICLWLAILLCLSTMMPAVTASAAKASDGYDYHFFNYTSFSNLGTWKVATNVGGYKGKILQGFTSSSQESKDAEALFVPQESGTYYVWVRSVDFEDRPGLRRFLTGINNGYLAECAGDFYDELGEGWHWSCVGKAYLTAGEVNKFRLIDYYKFWARFDAAVITTNPNFVGPEAVNIAAELEPYLVSDTGLTYENKWEGVSYYYNTAAISDYGTWTSTNTTFTENTLRQHFSNGYLQGKSNRDTSGNKPAVIRAKILDPGTYTLWVRSGNPATDNKEKSFQVEINGVRSGKLGNHAYTGFAWENAGQFTLTEGENVIRLHDLISYYPRFDSLMFTKDSTCQPSDFKNLVLNAATYVNSTTGSGSDLTEFPAYAKADAAPKSEVSIGNDTVQVKFYNIENEGKQFVQNEVFYKGDKLKSRTDNFGRMLFRYGTSTRPTTERASPILQVTAFPGFNTAPNDWTSDGKWGATADKIWTNMAKIDRQKETVLSYVSETISVPLNIPKSGYYYGLTRGMAYDKNNKRGYTVSVDGKAMTTNGATHYFNVTNNDVFQQFTFSYNTDPIYLEEGTVQVEMASSAGAAMRTSFFALIPAKNTSEIDALIPKLTNYKTAISLLGGTALDGYVLNAQLPVTTTGYPYPLTYDYVGAVTGNSYSKVARQVFDMGSGEWIIPVKAEKTGDNAVTLTYESPYATVTEVWSVEEGDQEPRVSMTITSKRNGNFSVVIPGHDSYQESEYEYLLAPMQYRGHGFPNEALLITEQYMFTPMVSVSLPENNTVVPGKKITYGFTVEPSWIPLRWVYNNTYKFGATMRAPTLKTVGNISPSLVAPAQGSTDCWIDAGESYTFQYRPIYRTGDWFDSFSHVFQDLFEFRDYRRNYYNSVTDAILNTTNLMMDDDYGGWDANGKGHWNMEGRTIASNSSPLESVQRFLLTDDLDILRERTVPTIINMLTRNSHFKSDTLQGGAVTNYVGTPDAWPSSVGKPSGYYGASVLGGVYEMSHGGIPYTMELAEQKAGTISDTSTSGDNISDLVGMYKYTGDSSYLEKAKKVADNYIESMKQRSILSTEPIPYGNFAYISYMPFISGLMDIYDVTGEQKYLDMAEYAGQVVLTLVWSVGIDGERAEQPMTITKEYLSERSFMASHNFWWHGEQQWRPGTNDGDPGECSSSENPLLQKGFSKLQDETVPTWVPSRVGIGLEQPSTFHNESLDMIMSNWAGDMMRLAEYTDNDLFEAAARNAIVGRFGTYSGYYVNRFVTYQMKANYPYETPVDFSGVYWHHIPPFLSMIEDFIIAQAWNWSERKIEFPSIRQQGYAYFNNNQYGYKPGIFFNEKDMWLWIDEGVVTTSSVQADWIAARKDGVMGIALMNEQNEPLTVDVTLGEKAAPNYTGTVNLYSPDGSVTTAEAVNGVFTVTIPGKSLIGAVLKSNEIHSPSYANIRYIREDSSEGTLVNHEDVSGQGLLLQLTPDRYFAHVYVADKPDKVSKAQISYTLGDDPTVYYAEDSQYPYEATIEVENVTKDFHYTVTTYDLEGNVLQTSKSYTMKPLQAVEEAPEENGETIFITGKNVKDKLKRTNYPFASLGSAGNSYILDEFSLYSRNSLSSEKPTLTVSVPEDGKYYIYANMRSGYTSYQPARSITLNISQDGVSVPVLDKDGTEFKFGYSNDYVALGNEATSNSFFEKGMGFRIPTPISLRKGIAEIQFNFGAYAGFDFVVLTKDKALINTLESCQYKPDCGIYKFWAENTELKELLSSYVDIEKPEAPVAEKVKGSNNQPGISVQLTDSEVSKNAVYCAYVNGQKYSSASKYAVLLKGAMEITGINQGDLVQFSVIDQVGNESDLSEAVTPDKFEVWYPGAFTYLKTGKDYASVAEAETANALPNGFTLLLTQENLQKTNNANKLDTNLLTGVKDAYYVSATNSFLKAFTGSFVIPEGKEDTYYQFISSYLRSHNGGARYKDNRRTHFILIDGMALTKNGLVPWNGKTSYNETDNYGTNAYVFGSEYPHEFTPDSAPTNVAYLCQKYPHTVVTSTAHLWGYSPAVQLEPGLHTVEVYSVGGTGWFNNLIITEDVGYDITKLFYGGLETRGTNWKNNYNNVAKPLLTDFVAPSFASNAGITLENDDDLGTLHWTEATDEGLGATGKNICYVVEIKDDASTVVATNQCMTNSLKLSDLNANTEYTVAIQAYDSAGNVSNTLTDRFTTSTPAVLYTENNGKATVQFFPERHNELVGKCSVYVATYENDSDRLLDVAVYTVDVAVGAANSITFDVPEKSAGKNSKIFIWKQTNLKPLIDVITP